MSEDKINLFISKYKLKKMFENNRSIIVFTG